MSTTLKGKEKQVAKKVEELGQPKAAKYFGINRSTFRDFLYTHDLPTRKSTKVKKKEDKENLELENQKLEQRVKELETQHRASEKIEVFSERALDVIETAAKNRKTQYTPTKFKRSTGKTLHEFSLLYSDLHAGEVVNFDEMNGINEYNWDIMMKRHDKLRKSLFSYQDNRTFPVEKLNLWDLGDSISGVIHDELIETNEMPVVEAAVQCAIDKVEWINSLKEGFKIIEVDVVCGNHARLQKDKKSKTGGYDNFDWMIGKWMESAFKNDPCVKVNLTKSSMQVVTVAKRNILLWHGDGVRSTMPGVPWGGIIRRSNNLQAQYSQIGKQIYLFALGHFHQLNLVHSASGWIAMNGSIVGGNEHSLKMYGHTDPPQQQLLTFHPTKGLTDTSVIDLKD